MAHPTRPWKGKGSAGLEKPGSRDLGVPGALSACPVSTPPSSMPGRLHAEGEMTTRVPDFNLVVSQTTFDFTDLRKSL